ncbi:MAG: type III pantothenate kinase, partial [Oscillospiraceae bacterium]
GVYDGDRPLFYSRAKTDPLKTEHEYAVLINEFLLIRGVTRTQITGAVLSSVVPALTITMSDAAAIISGNRPLVVGPGVRTGLNIPTNNPAEVGADLVCTAVGAMEKYPLPAIVIDLGTATKITAVDASRTFMGCSIAPGVLVSLSALSARAAQLPHIGLNTQIKTIGTNTIDCMMSGSILGAASMLDGMIARYRAAMGEVQTIVACGGLVNAIIPHCVTEGILIDKGLLLDGLMAIYRRNR